MRMSRRKVFKRANKQAIICPVNLFKLKGIGMSTPGMLGSGRADVPLLSLIANPDLLCTCNLAWLPM
jgi:hypothetical protein